MITSTTRSKAGRRDPSRAPDTDPSLGRAPGEFALQGSRGPQNGGLGQSCALTELGVCMAAMRTGGLRFFRLVPHRTTPQSRLLNIQSLVVTLVRKAHIARCPESRLHRTRNRTRVSQVKDDVLFIVKIGLTRPGFEPRSLESEISKLSQIDVCPSWVRTQVARTKDFSTTQKPRSDRMPAQWFEPTPAR